GPVTRRFINLSAIPLAFGLFCCAPDADVSDDVESAQAQLLDASVAPVDGGVRTSDASTAPFALTSSVVKDGELLPNGARCKGESPPLTWTPGPAGTKSYALVFQDLVNNYYHWVIYDIPATERGLPGNVQKVAAPAVPSGAKQAPNYSGARAYDGPCFPIGGERAYAFKVYALDVATLPAVTGNAAAGFVSAIEAHDLASATLNIKSKPGPR
ncbi:MAG: YbhB/YbcL family Raf kinase inhibitor-like protein, partial [Polyangiales bacterium]